MRPRSLIASLGTALGLGISAASPTMAQYGGIDPYRPYTRQYDNFVVPSYPVNGALPGAARYERNLMTGGAAADQLRSDRLNEALGLDEERDGYLINRATGRIDQPRYRSNQDEQFFEDQRDREQLYFDATQERDPKKRAEKMKQYEEARRKSTQSAARSATSRSGGKAKGTAAGKGDDLTSRLARDIVNGIPRTSGEAARNGGAREHAPAAAPPRDEEATSERAPRASEINPRRSPVGRTFEEPRTNPGAGRRTTTGRDRASTNTSTSRSERKSLFSTAPDSITDQFLPTDILYRSMNRPRSTGSAGGTGRGTP